MAYEQRPNSGSLFKNNRKEKPTHPDYRGDCLLNGQVLEISAWIKETRSGGKFMSLAFKPKQERQPQQQDAPLTGIDPADVPAPAETEIPF
jgi:hypothetical protein